MMIDRIYAIYFNGPKEILRFRTNSATKNGIALLKCLSLLTVVVPLGIWACKSLFGRVSKNPPGLLNKNLSSIKTKEASKKLFENLPEVGLDVENLILTKLGRDDLNSLSRTSKSVYNSVAASEALKIENLKTLAVGPEMWNRMGVKHITEQDIKEAYQALPKDMLDILKSDCPVFMDGRKVFETHMLVWIPSDLTLRKLRSLYEIRYYEPFMFDDLGSQVTKKSRWVLMTKEVIPGSLNKSYQEQQQLILDLDKKSYKVPTSLEAAACILGQFLSFSTCLFGETPMIFTRCKESFYQNSHAAVGGLSEDGLRIYFDSWEEGSYGVAPLLEVQSSWELKTWAS